MSFLRMKWFIPIFMHFTCTDFTSGKAADSPRRRPFGQLPTALSPTRYGLSIQPFFPADGVAYPPDRDFTFDANSTVSIACLDDTDNVTIHINRVELEEKSIQLVDVQTNETIPVSNYTYDNRTQQVVIPAKTTLKAGRSYDLHLKYQGILDGNSLAGFYPSSYVEDGRTKWLVATQFEPTDARRVLPSFDEPFYKASFEVTIIHPTSMVALSNSMEEKTEKLGNGWSKTTFEPTVNMSTYLLAMAVCDFRSRSNYTADNKTLFRVWARPSFIDRIDYALGAGPKVLDFYSKYFNVPFPLKKQDMLALPDFAAGAMENWGLVTYRETALLYDQKASTPSGLLQVAQTIAHELGHQWFGDLVTMEWWDDLWLNEGFATYTQYVGTDHISDGKFGMDQSFASGAVSSALSLDSLSTSHPIFVPVSSPDEINEIFDSISYKKGGSIIRMLNYTVGAAALRKGLQIYLTRHGYRNANHNDLWSAFTEAVQQEGTKAKDWRRQPLNVTEFMNPWVQQMGYPVLNVKRQYGSQQKIAKVDQTRFLLSNETAQNARPEFLSPPYNFTWYVPIWYQDGDTLRVQSDWLQPYETLTLYTSDDDKWLLVNYERAALCRVNYDERNWQLLAEQLSTNHTKIHAKNRIQLLDDSMALARANQLSYKIAMDMTLYLHNETEYDCWTTALDSLAFIQSMLALSPAYEDYKNYLAALTFPLYQRLGWDDTKEPVDEVDIHGLRAVALGEQCWLDLEDCTKAARIEFEKFSKACAGGKDPSSVCSPILPNLRAVVYCEGGKDQQNPGAWDLLWSLHAAEQDAGEKQRLLSGLSCTKNTSLIYKLLNETISENSTIIRRQDGSSVYSVLAGNDAARPLLWPFVEQNWRILRRLYAAMGMLRLDGILSSGILSFNTEDKLKMLRKWYSDHANELAAAKRAFEQRLEIVQASVEWMNRNGDIIIDWLKKQPLPVPPRKISKQR